MPVWQTTSPAAREQCGRTGLTSSPEERLSFLPRPPGAPGGETKSPVKGSPKAYRAMGVLPQSVTFAVDAEAKSPQKPPLLPALGSHWLQRGSRVLLCRLRPAFPPPARGGASLLHLSLGSPHFTSKKVLLGGYTPYGRTFFAAGEESTVARR